MIHLSYQVQDLNNQSNMVLKGWDSISKVRSRNKVSMSKLFKVTPKSPGHGVTLNAIFSYTLNTAVFGLPSVQFHPKVTYIDWILWP